MNSNNNIVIVGAGGHAAVLLDILHIKGIEPSAMVTQDETNSATTNTTPIISEKKFLSDFNPSEIFLVNGVGSVSKTSLRAKVFNKYKSLGFFFYSLIHPSSTIATDVIWGDGVTIMAGAIIQTGCKIGKNVLINTRASVDHHCSLGDHTHIAPGACLSGNVTVSSKAHIGTGAIIIQNKSIGKESIVGAGSVVIADVLPNKLVYGVPAKEKCHD